jgi:GR25 family glycosyltransferase involved in LPS biosynthesis
MNLVVINLPERNDRLKNMKKQFGDNFQIQEGIRHEMPHTGCGLAHIAAIRKGLNNSEFCIVLEDDCELLVSLELFKKTMKTLIESQDDFDVIVINPNHDVTRFSTIESIKKANCYQVCPNIIVNNIHCCIYSKSILPLLAEYEEILQKNYYLPIDRLYFSNFWDIQCKETFESCFDSHRNLKKELPPPLTWNTPKSFVYIDTDLIIQNKDFISDNTLLKFPEEFTDKSRYELYDRIRTNTSLQQFRQCQHLEIKVSL